MAKETSLKAKNGKFVGSRWQCETFYMLCTD